MFKTRITVFSEVDPEGFDEITRLVSHAENDDEGYVLGTVELWEMDTTSAVVDPDFPRDEFDRILDQMQELVYDERV
jgi:hypothetical protein